MRMIRAILMFLLPVLLFFAFYEESRLNLPSTDNTAAQLLILMVACGLALRLHRLDEIAGLRQIRSQDTPVYYHYRFESRYVLDMPTPEACDNEAAQGAENKYIENSEINQI